MAIQPEQNILNPQPQTEERPNFELAARIIQAQTGADKVQPTKQSDGLLPMLWEGFKKPAEELGKNIAWVMEGQKAYDRIKAYQEQGLLSDKDAEALLASIGEKPTFKKWLADSVSVVLTAAPIPAGIFAKFSPMIHAGLLGGGIGALSSAADATSENQSLKDTAIASGLGFALGAATLGLGKVAWKIGKVTALKGFVPLYKSISATEGYKTFTRLIRPVSNILANDFTPLGKTIVSKLKTADRNVQQTMGRVALIGKKIGAFLGSGADDRARAVELNDVVRGRIPFTNDMPANQALPEKGAITGRVGKKTAGFGAQEALGEQGLENIQDLHPVNFFKALFRDIMDEITKNDQVKVWIPPQGGQPGRWAPFAEVAHKYSDYAPKILGNLDDYRAAGDPKRLLGAVEKGLGLKPGRITREGRLRQAAIDQAMKEGQFETVKEANEALDSLISIWDRDGMGITKKEGMVKWMVKKGKASNEEEAISILREWAQRERQAVKLGNYIERDRLVDLPFYNPYIDEVALTYLSDTMTRLETIAAFGTPRYTQGGTATQPLLEKAYAQVRELQGEKQAEAFQKFVKIAMNQIDTTTAGQKVSHSLLMFQVPKLTFAQIINIGQSVLNPLLASDLKATVKGILAALTNQGMKNALESGATMQTIINETLRASVGSGSFADKYLKAVGFTWTERFNRTVASNVGIQWAQRNVEKLLLNNSDNLLKFRLRELGLDPDIIIKRGSITQNELLRAGQVFAEKTQFRSRPLDLPYWYSHPLGKLMWQFKNFAYQQTRFLFDQTVKEFQQGSRTKAARNLLLLMTVFPATGEVLQDLRSLITQSRRPTSALDRYISDIAGVGAAGMILDFVDAARFDRASDLVLGPTAGTFVELWERFDEPDRLLDELIRQTGVLTPISNVGREKRKGRESILETISNFGE